MAPVHLFSSNHDTVAHIATLLRSEFAIREHRLAERLPPPAEKEGGCIVFDMDEPNGWWRAMLAESIAKPSLPIVLVTAQPVVSDVVLAVQLGAKDVIDRGADPARLRQVARDLMRRAPAAARARAAAYSLDSLTRRQREILALASAGLPSKAIAKSLSISKRTVDAHRSRMVRRLKARSFLELVREQIFHESRANGA